MDVSLKDGIYFGSVLVAFVWNYANTNKKIDMNKRELDSLREMLNLVIDKEKTLFQKEFETVNSKLDTYFKKIDELRVRIESMEKTSISFIKKDESLRQHPTKDEIDNKLLQLEKTDSTLNNEIIAMKKDINKKFDKIEQSLEEHIREERKSFKENQEMLNKILVHLKG